MTTLVPTHRTRTFLALLPPRLRRPMRRTPAAPPESVPHGPAAGDGPGAPDVWLAGLRLGG
ncbi:MULTISPECIES: hypothetical protein [unclassified Streptomyces]|uniref:hypothetical protein n=1 Tax=unclassified Streptomyces TaxID=2593676 RepID=UPI002E804151|nr:hypothetical protein [Streptomyces sp. NBC_00589]WTI41315.1 hypothetical protein OIC96_43120 [Streptomyces sp. NBC_00775]WUB25001.1 hypothetical protein OHA51_06605 [Streptomyces sp. NBC_00589]